MPSEPQHAFWIRTRRLTAGLLAAWVVLSVLAPWFARELNAVVWLGFPLGFWWSAQGALLAFLVLIVLYVVGMERLEERYHEECSAANEPGSGAS